MKNVFNFELNNNSNNKKIFIQNIYGSMSINNIENYLKRIESLKKQINSKKLDLELILVPNSYVYSIDHINWAIYIAKSKFVDKLNISKKLWPEILLTLNCSNQINKIKKEWKLQEGNSKVFLCLVSNSKLLKKDISKIIKDLELKELKTMKFNKKESKNFYKIKSNSNEIYEIIEKMATVSLK